jgi:hypothetical protein
MAGKGDSAAARAWYLRSGTLTVAGVAAVLLIGWFAYQPYIPPIWLHDLAQDISYRAALPPGVQAEPPADFRQVTPRGLADSPYICVTKTVHIPWDHMYVVTATQDLRAHPVLSQATWPHHNFDHMADELKTDKRYQLLVMMKDNTVTDAQLFYTFWGDLSGISQPEGYNRENAVFTAASKISFTSYLRRKTRRRMSAGQPRHNRGGFHAHCRHWCCGLHRWTAGA